MLRGGRIDAHATDRVNDLSGGGPGMGSVRLAAMIMFHGWPYGGSSNRKVKSLMRAKERHIIRGALSYTLLSGGASLLAQFLRFLIFQLQKAVVRRQLNRKRVVWGRRV